MVSLHVPVEHGLHRAGPERFEAVDFGIALTAGPNAWVTPDSASMPMVRAGLSVALIGLLTMATLTVVELLYHAHGRSPIRQVALVAVALGSIALLASSVIAAIRRQQYQGGRHSMRILRIAALLAFCAIWISTVPPAESPLIWPLGLFIGVEAALTARLIGHDRGTIRLYRDYFVSPLHFGAIAAVLSCELVFRTASLDQLSFSGLCSLEVAALSAVLSYGVARRKFEQEVQFSLALQLAERSREFRQRAHWIHDDVCADLREIRVRMATQTLDRNQISRELDRLDDRLRERQLDEMMNGGAVTAAEILQSYVRRAQNAGLTITDVPRFDDASVRLAGEPARLLRRCMAGFVTNALAAGASSLSFQLKVHEGDFIVAVTDDAGGFDLATAPAGRGLASIAAELGENRLTSERTATGTTMTARIRLE